MNLLEEILEGKILFIDDKKDPLVFNCPSNTVVVRSYNEAIQICQKENFDIIYLDHDLAETGRDGSQLLFDICVDYFIPKKVFSITRNAVGVKRIRDVCGDFGIDNELI